MIDRITKMDKVIFLLSLLMMGFGIVFVYSSSFAIAQQKFGGSDFFLARHVVRVLLGLFCFFIFISIDYHALGKNGYVSYFISVILLVYTLTLPDSQAVNGAKRWANIGFFRFQVSEFARIALILTMAMHMDKLGDRIRDGSVFMQQLIKIGIICALIIVEPDFSTALIIGGVGLCILYVSGAKLLHITGVVFAFVPVIILAVVSTPYRLQRLMGYLNMSS
ncbi:MAG: FtsW/RodA/SpoVE family cell cycle protein, partial [bacterium]|nr:FtsW/RodA/SpoVE family cell cycle protein [bacterium]